jgi:hypothetical protein
LYTGYSATLLRNLPAGVLSYSSFEYLKAAELRMMDYEEEESQGDDRHDHDEQGARDRESEKRGRKEAGYGCLGPLGPWEYCGCVKKK